MSFLTQTHFLKKEKIYNFAIYTLKFINHTGYMIKVGIIADDGTYVAGELVRILINHPDVELKFFCTPKYEGKEIGEIYDRLYGELDLKFTSVPDFRNTDMLFLNINDRKNIGIACHEQWTEKLKVVDMSATQCFDDEPYEYGLPELNRRATCHSSRIKNPGNIATAVSLALLPMAKHLMLNNTVWAHVTTGTSADIQPAESTMYRLFAKEDTAEVTAAMKHLQNSFATDINILPCHGSYERGTFATVMTKTGIELDELKELYVKYYEEDSFTFLSDKPLRLKQVIGTNKCLIHLDKEDDKLVITACTDNLQKGSAGQAVHNMNLMFNLEETTGLYLQG